MAKNNNAVETAEEFKEKYGRKRFTSSNAGKIVLYNYVYAAYQIEEGAKTEDIKPLYSGKLKDGGTRSAEGVVSRIDSTEDLLRYNAFVHLQEWTENAFKTTVFMRNALKSVISDYYNIASSIIAAEAIKKALGDKADEPDISIWLSSLTIDSYTPQTNGGGIYTLRRNIALALRYIKAYNTFIEMIAAAVDVPEYTVFKVSMQSTEASLSHLNVALSMVVSDIRNHRGTDDEYLNETLKAFEPVEMEAEPIPTYNIKKADAIISTVSRHGYKTWTSAFAALYAGYWRQA